MTHIKYSLLVIRFKLNAIYEKIHYWLFPIDEDPEEVAALKERFKDVKE